MNQMFGVVWCRDQGENFVVLRCSVNLFDKIRSTYPQGPIPLPWSLFDFGGGMETVGTHGQGSYETQSRH